jgi:hypothetical protein
MTCAADPVTGRPAMALGIDKFCGRAIFVDFVKDVSLNNISITTKQGQFEVKEPVHEFLSNL